MREAGGSRRLRGHGTAAGGEARLSPPTRPPPRPTERPRRPRSPPVPPAPAAAPPAPPRPPPPALPPNGTSAPGPTLSALTALLAQEDELELPQRVAELAAAAGGGHGGAERPSRSRD